MHLVIDGELIETTPEHPFYTINGEWVEAENLTIGDLIWSLDGDYGAVQDIDLIHAQQPMYNLTVDEAHTFFVGSGDWLVHNTCDFRRFGSEIEVDRAASTGRLEFPTSGVGNRKEKWVALANSISPNAKFGDATYYTHRMDIETSGDALNWLERNAIDYDDYRIAVEDGLELVPGTDARTRDVLVLTKPNEPGWFGLTRAGLGLFNRNITGITSTRIR